eukprot:365213-Chlamydomonas_euryale.AAC.3
MCASAATVAAACSSAAAARAAAVAAATGVKACSHSCNQPRVQILERVGGAQRCGCETERACSDEPQLPGIDVLLQVDALRRGWPHSEESALMRESQAAAWQVPSLMRESQAAAWQVSALMRKSQAAAWQVPALMRESQAAAWQVPALMRESQAAAWQVSALMRESQAAAWQAAAWQAPALMQERPVALRSFPPPFLPCSDEGVTAGAMPLPSPPLPSLL